MAESLFERLTERDIRQKQALEEAERTWSGKSRSCPRAVPSSNPLVIADSVLNVHMFFMQPSRFRKCDVVARNYLRQVLTFNFAKDNTE